MPTTNAGEPVVVSVLPERDADVIVTGVAADQLAVVLEFQVPEPPTQ